MVEKNSSRIKYLYSEKFTNALTRMFRRNAKAAIKMHHDEERAVHGEKDGVEIVNPPRTKSPNK